MTENRTADASLFELLARQWSFDEEVLQTEFNATDTAVLFRLRSGKLALVAIDDSESTKSRTRIELDSGRTTIQRRQKPIPRARFPPIKVKPTSTVVRVGKQGFLAIDHMGSPHLITAGAQSIEKFASTDTEITATCSDPHGNILAISRSSGITIYQTGKMEVLAQLCVSRKICHMAFCAKGKMLAVFGEGTLDIIDTKNPETPTKSICGLSHITQLTWDKTGHHVACASSENSFHIVDTDTDSYHTVEGYPSPVSTVAFSEKGQALLTSGAFRLTGWSSDDLPKQDHTGMPLKTGKAGMTIINTIAAHPSRSLVAVGYANGLVIVTSIGNTQEMMVHHETETQVKTLTWSNSGEHLAIGFKSGKAALVSFPDNLFK